MRVGSALAVAGTAHQVLNLRRAARARRAAPPVVAEPVTVALPVRDEAHRVAPTLRGAAAQRGVPDLELLVLDDGSTDGTADVVGRGRPDGDPRVRLLRGTPPRAGAARASRTPARSSRRRPAASVLVFVDADVRARAARRRGRGDAAARRAGWTCCPRGRASSPTAPRPGWCSRCWQWSWMVSLPLRRAERSPRPALCAANGQFLVVDAAALARAGGFAAVAGAVLDDLAVARAVKRAGGRVGVADGAALAACRMYDGWAELSAGYRKSLWAAFGPAPASAAVAGRLALAYVVPPLAALRGSRVGLVGYAAAVASRVLAARRHAGGRAWPDALAHPASVTVLLGLLGASWRGHRRGELTLEGPPARRAPAPRGVRWRASS